MSSSTRVNIVETFKSELQNVWRQNPKCRSHTHCSCLRPFVRTSLLKRWMIQKASGSNKSNGERLIEAVNPPIAHLGCHPRSILEGDQSCVLVFSWLLERDYGRLINVFQNAGVNDQKLQDIYYELADKSDLKRELEELIIPGLKINFKKLAIDFEKSRWEFCPVYLKSGIDNKPFADKLFIPFCARKGVNEKGGTGSVFQVAIQEEFVSEDIRKDLGASFDFEDHGKCYQLAVKTILDGQRSVYSKEWQAFKGLRERKGVLRFFGSFYSEDSVRGRTYNLLLEFASNDLFEWFYAFDPPQLPVEINSNWEKICDVAAAIETLHRLEHNGKIFNGWHCDIKPDNVLHVGDDWKLADFGFAIFEEEIIHTVPTTKLLGGTETYGAPETVRPQVNGVASADRQAGCSGISQKVDIWSFGCVLSMMATWIVKGCRGIDEYRILRTLALKDLSTAKHIAPDGFHGGSDVLPQIRHWHSHLREIRRHSDTITPAILDLVDNELLLGDPEARLSSEELSVRLKKIVAEAKSTLMGRTPTENSVMLALLSTEIDGTNRSDVYIKPEHSSDGNKDPRFLGVSAVTRRSHRNDVASKMEEPHTSIPQRLEALGSCGLVVRRKDSRPGSFVDSNRCTPRRFNSPDHITGSFLSGQASQSQQAPLQSQPGPADSQTSSFDIPANLLTRQLDPPRLRVDPPPDRTESPLKPVFLLDQPSAAPKASLESLTDSGFTTLKNPPSADEIWDCVSASNCKAVEILTRDDQNIAKDINTDGRTPIMVAAQQNDISMVKTLISFSDLSVQDKEGKTVLHYMIMGLHGAGRTESHANFLDTVKAVLSQKHPDFDLVNCLDGSRRSALLFCALNDMPKTAKILINENAWINPPRDSNMRNILIEAARGGKDDMLEFLLDAGARSDWSALQMYKENVSRRVWRLIKDKHDKKQPSSKSQNFTKAFKAWI